MIRTASATAFIPATNALREFSLKETRLESNDVFEVNVFFGVAGTKAVLIEHDKRMYTIDGVNFIVKVKFQKIC